MPAPLEKKGSNLSLAKKASESNLMVIEESEMSADMAKDVETSVDTVAVSNGKSRENKEELKKRKSDDQISEIVASTDEPITNLDQSGEGTRINAVNDNSGDSPKESG